MIKFKRSQIIDAKPEDVWKVIGNYMEIDEFAPQIVSTEAMTDGENGVGSVRKNVFANGGYMVEEVTDWMGREPERINVDKGYVGHDVPKLLRELRSGQKRGIHGQIKREISC